MLIRKRLSAGGYFLLFIVLLAIRSTSTTWLVVVTQTLFSADVLMNWLRMERFHSRVNHTREQLHQFFVQGGASGPNGVAVGLTAFSDYECSKDEAAIPLDSGVFKELNPIVTKEWDELRRSLNIP